LSPITGMAAPETIRKKNRQLAKMLQKEEIRISKK
jgi:hypothetical protein